MTRATFLEAMLAVFCGLTLTPRRPTLTVRNCVLSHPPKARVYTIISRNPAGPGPTVGLYVP